MELFNDPLLVFWRAFGDSGLIIVIIAVVLEVAAAAIGTILERLEIPDFKKWESRLKRYEVIAGWILVLGLAVEYKGHREETIILDSDNAGLYDDAKQAEREAGAARVISDEIESTNAQLVATNLLLRKTVAELELKVIPRHLTIKQLNDFICL
jgi:hypothetical protein